MQSKAKAKALGGKAAKAKTAGPVASALEVSHYMRYTNLRLTYLLGRGLGQGLALQCQGRDRSLTSLTEDEAQLVS